MPSVSNLKPNNNNNKKRAKNPTNTSMSAESPLAHVVRDDTLIKLLHAERVPMTKVITDYPDFAGIVKVMIGIVPVCDSYLEMWPKAMKSYNLLVPNLTNAPFTQMRVGPGYGRGAMLQGLGMYVVSKSAECPYCSAHTCSYALRRGASMKALLDGFRQNPDKELELDEQTTIAVARSLGRVPCELTSEERSALVLEVGEKVAESIVFGMLMMGYLNKVMDSLGVELENSTYLETKDVVGADYANSKAGVLLHANEPATMPPPKDSLGTILSIIPRIPRALMLDWEYTKGVPNTWPEVGEHLQKCIGYSFPGLSAVSQSFLGKRAVVSIATVLIDNYDVNDTYCTVPVKVMAGLIFANVAQSDALKADFQALAAAFNLSEDEISLARKISDSPSTEELPNSPTTNDLSTRAYLRLARAISSSPAEVSIDVVNELEQAKVESKGIVEMVNFIAVAQLLLRLDAFYPRDS